MSFLVEEKKGEKERFNDGFNYSVLLLIKFVVEEAIKIMSGACMCYESVPCDLRVLIETLQGAYETEKGPLSYDFS